MSPLTPKDTESPVELCRAGKLYEIEKRIASGQSIQPPPKSKKSLLQIAVDTGFHSMVELLAGHEISQETKNGALADAVPKRRLDLVQILVLHGAQVNAIPLDDVLLTWEPTLIRFFLENGADVITGAPFAVAFREKIRTALRPFVDYKNAHPDLATGLQEQADIALRHFCREGDLKWVSLMIWAGATPGHRGRCSTTGMTMIQNATQRRYRKLVIAASWKSS